MQGAQRGVHGVGRQAATGRGMPRRHATCRMGWDVLHWMLHEMPGCRGWDVPYGPRYVGHWAAGGAEGVRRLPTTLRGRQGSWMGDAWHCPCRQQWEEG